MDIRYNTSFVGGGRGMVKPKGEDYYRGGERRYMVINKPPGMICVNNDTKLVTGTWADASERAQQKKAGQQVQNLGTFPRFLVKKYSDYYSFLSLSRKSI